MRVIKNEIPQPLEQWAKSISLRSPKVMTSLYDTNAILVGTYSKPMEFGQKQIHAYFVDFLNKENLKCEITSNIIQHFGNGAFFICSGTYSFSFENTKVEARYSICYKRGVNGFKIVNQHSSELP